MIHVARYELPELLQEFDLPELPHGLREESEGARDLVIYRQFEDNLLLTGDYSYGVTLEDAQAYCELDSTRGAGWFVGFESRLREAERTRKMRIKGKGKNRKERTARTWQGARTSTLCAVPARKSQCTLTG